MLDHVERKFEVTESFEKHFPMDCNMPYKIKLVTPFFCSGNLKPKDPKRFWSPTAPTANGLIIFTDVFPSFPVGDRGILT